MICYIQNVEQYTTNNCLLNSKTPSPRKLTEGHRDCDDPQGLSLIKVKKRENGGNDKEENGKIMEKEGKCKSILGFRKG